MPGGWGLPRYSTGLSELDARLGGVAAGELWVLTGAPGQGRSMLLTQLALRLACEHQVPTWLGSTRDPALAVSGRLHAAVARVALNHVVDDRLTAEDRPRLDAATAQLDAAPLRLLAGRFAAGRVLDELVTQPHGDLVAAFFDDPDWSGAWDLQSARDLADRGAAVVVALPRTRVLDGPAYRCDLHPEMSLADIVVEVRHTDLTAAGLDPVVDQPGHAVLAVLRNRRGPVGSSVAAFQGHYARFVDAARPGG